MKRVCPTTRIPLTFNQIITLISRRTIKTSVMETLNMNYANRSLNYCFEKGLRLERFYTYQRYSEFKLI